MKNLMIEIKGCGTTWNFAQSTAWTRNFSPLDFYKRVTQSRWLVMAELPSFTWAVSLAVSGQYQPTNM
ncbi:MAG: hypothetical protein PHU14_16215 [Methylovulum sp.]|nr:hypothetical protein [Methylovulum sp.]